MKIIKTISIGFSSTGKHVLGLHTGPRLSGISQVHSSAALIEGVGLLVEGKPLTRELLVEVRREQNEHSMAPHIRRRKSRPRPLPVREEIEILIAENGSIYVERSNITVSDLWLVDSVRELLDVILKIADGSEPEEAFTVNCEFVTSPDHDEISCEGRLGQDHVSA